MSVMCQAGGSRWAEINEMKLLYRLLVLLANFSHKWSDFKPDFSHITRLCFLAGRPATFKPCFEYSWKLATKALTLTKESKTSWTFCEVQKAFRVLFWCWALLRTFSLLWGCAEVTNSLVEVLKVSQSDFIVWEAIKIIFCLFFEHNSFSSWNSKPFNFFLPTSHWQPLEQVFLRPLTFFSWRFC